MHLSPEMASFELTLDECSNLTKAYEATRKTFSEHLSRRNGFDPNLSETAKNSHIFQLIDDLKSVFSTSAYSMSCLFKGVELNAVPKLFKKIENVKIEELKDLLGSYIMPLFGDENSNCLVVCHPAKSEAVVNEFSESFHRKLNVVGKLDECFCSLIDKISI
jgi:Zn-dependent M16 (insulinase) family peptidase